MRSALRWLYGWKRTFTTPWKKRDPEAIAQKIDDPDNIRLVAGHVDFGLHRYLPGDCRYFTMLRDPVERILSQFHYISQGWPESQVAEMSLEEYVTEGHHTYVHNDQVRRISGVNPKQNPARALNRAKGHLQNRVEFGITEKFDESLIYLQRQLNWGCQPYYVRLNTNSGSKNRGGKKVRSKVEYQNELDCTLYEFARAIFDNRVNRLEMGHKVKRFKVVRSVLQPIGVFAATLKRKMDYMSKNVKILESSSRT